jgi:hypothetical protein
MSKYVHKSKYFYGHEVSDYGLKNGYVDYRTLSKAFDMVLNNSIIEETRKMDMYWEIVNGSDVRYYDKVKDEYVECDEIEEWDNIEECYSEIYQYYIISDRGYDILSDLTDEIVFYNSDLDMYIWGVTHWGTSWDYVLTDIKINLESEE